MNATKRKSAVVLARKPYHDGGEVKLMEFEHVDGRVTYAVSVPACQHLYGFDKQEALDHYHSVNHFVKA